MMKSVLNFEKTILVKRYDRDFVIIHLGSGREVTLNQKEFYGNFFKYEGEFNKKFRETFPDKKIDCLIFSNDASDLMYDLLFFNRVDN